MAVNGDPSILLDKLGRASTPVVPISKMGITLGKLMGTGVPSDCRELCVLMVGRRLEPNVRRAGYTPIVGVPGLLVEQAQDTQVAVLLIDECAFDSGTWLGADIGVSRVLGEEIFEAGRQLRATGRPVYFVPHPQRNDGVDLAYIRSTSTAIVGAIPEIDLEEQATQTPLWREIFEGDWN